MKLHISDKLVSEEAISNTPKRWKSFMKEYERKRKPFNFTCFENLNYDQMIILRDIDFSSMCEHHALPFRGKVSIGYIPKDIICGASKIARTVDMFASKPQLQEQLTQDIANFLWEKLQPYGLMIVIEATHDCMRIRGVMKNNSVLVTSAVKGSFEKLEVRTEFLNLVRRNGNALA